MSDVLSGITAHTLGADLLANTCVGRNFRCAAILLLYECDHISIDLSKDKGGIVLERELTFLNGSDRDRATAEHS